MLYLYWINYLSGKYSIALYIQLSFIFVFAHGAQEGKEERRGAILFRQKRAKFCGGGVLSAIPPYSKWCLVLPTIIKFFVING